VSIIQAIVNLLGILRRLFDWIDAEKHKQEGRDEVSTKVNKESADAQERMARVSDPSDDDIARRMSDGSFLYSQDSLPDDQVLRQGDTRQGAARIPTFAERKRD